MKTALVGYTGVVGSNLLLTHPFDDLYNSQNIADIRGQHYDLVVSAANRADSFRINRNQSEDLAEINALADNLEAASIGKLVLISTVCVYPGCTSPDESTPLTPDGLTPYGQNRLHQEQRLGAAFDVLPIRLPQLYGANMKKGIIFDLANNYRVEFIRPHGEFQYYDLRRLWGDIAVALENGLDSLNIATPPLTSERVAREAFGIDVSGNRFDDAEDPFSGMYTRDMRTIHADLYGGIGGYLCDEEQEITGIREFAEELRARA